MNNKLKALAEKAKSIYGEVYSSYRVTMIMVDISTVIGCILAIVDDSFRISFDSTLYCILNWLVLFFIYLSAGCLCIESLPKNIYEKNGAVKKTAGIILSAVLSGILVSIYKKQILGLISIEDTLSLNDTVIASWIFAYFVLIALSTFYFKYKESNQPIEKYFVNIVTEIIQICIAWGILAVGFLLLTFIFEELIGSFDGLFTVPQVLIIGLFVVPRFIIGISAAKDEIGKFFEVLIKYVILIITIVGAAIIYLYIIKLIFTGIPSNEIFSITSTLFFVAIPIGFACTAFDKDTLLQKIAYLLPFVYAPFIILQGYSIFARISEYGITPSRYMGVVLIVLEIIYTVVYAFFRKHIDKVILIMMGITVIITLIPGVNLNAMSRISQKKIVVNFVENGLSGDFDKEQNRIAGAYTYLKSQYGEEYLKSFLSEEDEEKIAELDDQIKTSNVGSYNLLNADMEFIPTDGYDYVAEFSARIDSFDADRSPSNMTITIGDKEYGPYDMSEEYESVKQRCIEDKESRVEGYDVLKVSDDEELIFIIVRINEDSNDGEMLDFYVWGYYLTNNI